MKKENLGSVKALKKTAWRSGCHGMRCRCSAGIKYVCVVCEQRKSNSY